MIEKSLFTWLLGMIMSSAILDLAQPVNLTLLAKETKIR
ncbi:MAG: hypothetical protein SCABRO_00090 [Candidatus Scalindua brodae]|uniref:Uncharacterized protein n=1 Tax=Candidatus Scalindua brodae TaxID=237368 RepID=A0A0B0ETY1_9BACT|nr:MAG: hypothetical protein SCABRO_00090 [Candidatus Scalindua brodae]